MNIYQLYLQKAEKYFFESEEYEQHVQKSVLSVASIRGFELQQYEDHSTFCLKFPDLLSKPVQYERDIVFGEEEPNWEDYVLGYHEEREEYEVDKKWDAAHASWQSRKDNWKPLLIEPKYGWNEAYHYTVGGLMDMGFTLNLSHEEVEKIPYFKQVAETEI